MAKNDETLPSGDLLVVGAEYYIKMRGTGKKVRARFNGRQDHNAFGGSIYHPARSTKTYHFTNLETGRDIITRSKQVILRPV